MQRFVWTSDNHLDRMNEPERLEFKEHLAELAPDGFIIAGDTGEAESLTGFLEDFRQALSCPIYFVLGNHDFWYSSFEKVHADIRRLTAAQPALRWLTESGIIALNETTALIGADGWADARFGRIGLTGNVPRDFMRIDDLKALRREQFEQALNNLGDAAARIIRKSLTEAAAEYSRVYLVMHVPPFREAALDRSRRICDDEKLPFYSCKAVGDAILEIMSANPGCRLTILCGHTHEKCEAQIAPNISVKILDAGYGSWYPPGMFEI